MELSQGDQMPLPAQSPDPEGPTKRRKHGDTVSEQEGHRAPLPPAPPSQPPHCRSEPFCGPTAQNPGGKGLSLGPHKPPRAGRDLGPRSGWNQI